MQTLSSYSYASVNAYNIYALLGLNWIEIKGIFWLLWQIIVLAGITSFSIWFYIKAKGNDKIFYTAYLLIVLVFNLSTKMHERYISLLCCLFLYVIYIKISDYYTCFCANSSTAFNTGIIYINSVYDDMQILMTGVVSILNIIITVFSIYWGCKFIFRINPGNNFTQKWEE